jgi:predicted ATPase
MPVWYRNGEPVNDVISPTPESRRHATPGWYNELRADAVHRHRHRYRDFSRLSEPIASREAVRHEEVAAGATMITSVEIQNLKKLRKLEMDLGSLTVLVGANGSGKTSVLEAIDLAVRAMTGTPQAVFAKERHCDWLYTRGGEGGLSITCRTPSGGLTVEADRVSLVPPPPDRLGKEDWGFMLSAQENVVVGTVLLQMLPLVFLRLDATRLARPSYSDHDPPRLEFDGEGLASVLAFMALNAPDAFHELIESMQSLIPQFKRIRFRKARIKRNEKEYLRVGNDSVERRTSRIYLGEAILFDFANADNLSAHTVSEGTLLLLGLLTVLLGPSRPRVLLMDDIEHGLHPLAQKSLIDVLRQMMRKFPDLQIVATAHSPYLVDHLRPEEVRLMTVGEDGFAVCGRLEDHPQFNKWKGEMAPGELWSLFGEKWLAEVVVAK